MTSSSLPEKTPAHLSARVLERTEVAPRHFRFSLLAPPIAAHCRPGQFVHVLAHSGAFAASFDPLLRRAFSILTANPSAGSFDFLFRVEGRGTQLLSQFQVGESIDILGPLGRPFDLTPFENESVSRETRAILVGGGVGVPPLLFLAQHFQNVDVETMALVGARTHLDVLGQQDFALLGVPVTIATEDGSLGFAGRITAPLKKTLLQNQNAIVYACGPLPMLRAVAKLCEEHGVRCQVSLEENMPCGVGVCNGCVVPALQSSDPMSEWTPYHRYRRICIEGPACWANEIDWS